MLFRIFRNIGHSLLALPLGRVLFPGTLFFLIPKSGFRLTHEDAACSLFDVMKSPILGRSSLIPPHLKDFFFFPQEYKLFLGDGNMKDQQNGMGFGRETRKLHKGKAVLLS